MRNGMMFFTVLALMISSAVGVIYVKQQSRTEFIEYQRLLAEKEGLDVDWGRLQLEQSTWATSNRIEMLSREKLGMVNPEPEFVLVTENN
ncbi:MAG: cell division protein FtsL [Gammaproteobacteria bacterium]|nr:MAG: cell division protein FtsL [Gammaproteobacteria bacterium]